MNDTRPETTLAQVRVHWGICILPVLAGFALALPMLAIIHFMNSMASHLNPQTSRPIGGLFVLILLLPAILVGLPLLLAAWVAYRKSTITLTERRLIYGTGLLARLTGELPLENVEAIILAEPLLGRWLGYGTVIVTSVGGLRFPLRYTASPQSFHATLQKAVAAAKSPVAKPPPPPRDDDSRYMPKG